MFCSSLRRRKEWVTLPSTLIKEKVLKWRGCEGNLNTHDLSIPMPRSREEEQQVFRVLLLSSSDMESSTHASARIERLDHQTGGRNVGIIFLLHEKGGSENGMKEYLKLQMSLMSTSKIAILPLASVSHLLATVQSFQRQLCMVPPSKKVDAPHELLPFSNVGDAMTEHTRNILSDICHSIPEVAGAATTSHGQEQLKEWLSAPHPNSAQGVIDFWQREYLLE